MLIMDDTPISRSLGINELDLSLSQHDVEILWNNDSPSPTVRQAKRLKANLKREQPSLSQIARKFDAVEGKSCVPPLLAAWLESEPSVAVSAKTFEQERKGCNRKKRNTRHVAKDSRSLIAELQNIVHTLQQPTRYASSITGKNDAVSNAQQPDMSGSDGIFSSDEDIKQIDKNQVNVERKDDMADNSAWGTDDPFDDDSFVRETIALTQRVEQDTQVFSPPALPRIHEICNTSTPVSSRIHGGKWLLSRKRDKELMASPVLCKQINSGTAKIVKKSGGSSLNGISEPTSLGLSNANDLAVPKTFAPQCARSTSTSQAFAKPQRCTKPECENSNARALVDILIAPPDITTHDTSTDACDDNNSITDDLLLALAEPDNSLDNLVPCQPPSGIPHKESSTKLTKCGSNSSITTNIIKPENKGISSAINNRNRPFSHSTAASVSSASSNTVAVSKYARSNPPYSTSSASSNISPADSKLACGNTGVTQHGPLLRCQRKSGFTDLVTKSSSIDDETTKRNGSQSINHDPTTSQDQPLHRAVNSSSVTTRNNVADCVTNKNKVDVLKPTKNSFQNCSTVHASGLAQSAFPSSESFYSIASGSLTSSRSRLSNNTSANPTKRLSVKKSSKNNNPVALSKLSASSARTAILNNVSKSASVPMRTDFSKKKELSLPETTVSSMPNIKAHSSAEQPSDINGQHVKGEGTFGDDKDDSLLQSEEFLTMLNFVETTASQKSKYTAKEIEEKRQQAIARRSQQVGHSLSQEATPSCKTRQLLSKALSSSNL